MKLFQQMLVAGASVSLLAPIAAQASDVVNLEEINSYTRGISKSSKIDSKTFINEVSEELASLKGRVDGLEVKQNNLEAGSFSDTTTLSGKAVFVVGAIDHPELDSAATDDTSNESIQAQYQYTMDLNTSFTGDDNLYVRLRTGNGHDGKNPFGITTYGTYLVSNSDKYSDTLNVDKIWYTFPVGDNNTVWVGPKIENYYMHASTPSIYKAITKQFVLGGNGAAYGASTKTGAGWAYKADNGFALSSNVVTAGNSTTGVLTEESQTSWANQIGYTTDNYSISLMMNLKYNGWSDSYYSTASGKLRANDANSTNYGLRGWWRPEDSGTATPSISVGYDISTIENDSTLAADQNETDSWFVGLNWSDIFRADDKVGIAFGQPQTREDETVEPFAWEAYYSFKVNDSVTVTPAVFGGSDRKGTANEDMTGAILETTFKF
tara:strand:- start:1390 stop:2697 length:1308 start_codon:yes stop_codon:yes gene_type:complete